MNIPQLRQSLKINWLTYYHRNRPWLVKMRVWGTYDGQRRPSSGFILATLSVLEPQLDQIFPLFVDLSNNPDQIVAALGLNFNPEEQLHLLKSDNHTTATQIHNDIKLPLAAFATQPPSESAFQTLDEDKPEVSVAVATGVENKSFVPSVAIATKVEKKTLHHQLQLLLKQVTTALYHQLQLLLTWATNALSHQFQLLLRRAIKTNQ